MVAYVGFKQTYIEYDRDERSMQEKVNIINSLGSLKIGLNGLIGFSSRPLFLMSVTWFCYCNIKFSIRNMVFISKNFRY